MPELPEIETTIQDLKKIQPPILGSRFVNVWTDFKKIIKRPKNFEDFRKKIKGKRIEKIWRRGKNILFDLSENKILLIHQKLTGHLLVGTWILKSGIWKPKEKKFLEEKINSYIHLMFSLDNGQMLALSDLRKFAKVELWDKDELINSSEFKSLGPEPLEKFFTFEKFKEVLPKKGKIKQLLMDQTVIAGIGNIYSDEILWESKIHPFKDVRELNEDELKRIYQAIKKILLTAIKLKGESISDFRRISGEKGGFDLERKVYRKEGEKCSRCGTIIRKVKLASRSAHFCPTCQKF